MNKLSRKTFYFIAIFTLLGNLSAKAEGLIRDAETERFLRNLSAPIFRAADLNAENINLYIVNDNSINAFVSGGQNVFINTGLLRKYNTPDTLIGVLAHETGHIKGGHLARNKEGAQQAEGAMLLSYLLGIGAIIGGSPDAGAALLLGGAQSAQRLYAKFTRTQEEAADQYAIEFLDKLKYPADGLVNLLEFFDREMLAYKGQYDEYLLSHPVSRKRIDLIKSRTEQKKFSDKEFNKKLQNQMNWVLAKLEGFIDEPNEVLQKYQNRHDDLANYAKAIAIFRKNKSPQSIELLDRVIANNPNNGFLLETKGQLLFESGNVEQSSLAYKQALKLLPTQDAALAKISLASAILSLNTRDAKLMNYCIEQLLAAKKYESENPYIFKQLATAYNRINDEGRSLLALAEFNLLINEKEKCRKYAKQAKEKLDKSLSEEQLHADDLIEAAAEEKPTKEQ